MDYIQNTSAQTPASTSASKKYAADTFSIKDIILVCLSKWYYFAITVAIAMIVALLYIASTAPTYSSSACLLIKQDRRTGSNGIESASAGFSNFGKLFAQQTNVFNEIIAFQSPSLMEEVVRRLDLRADYTTKRRMYKQTLYGSSLPLVVSMIDFPDAKSMGLTIKYRNRKSVELTKMHNYIGGEMVEYKGSIVANFQDTVDTPVGKMVIVPTILFYDTEVPFSDISLSYSSLGSAVGRHRGGLSVALTDKEATAITLSKSDRSSERARDILSTLITVYNEKWVSDQNQIAVSTSEFINDRLVVIEEELGNVDSDISQYKSRNQLLDPNMSGSMYLSQATKIQDNITDINNRLGVAKYIRSYMASAVSTNQLLPANSGLDNSNIEGQISEYNSKQLQRNNLVANSSTDNPVVVSLDADLQALHRNILASIDNYIEILNTQVRSMEGVAARNASKISVSPIQAEHLTDIQRQQKVKESLYLFLLQKREENELSQAFTAYNTRVLTPPSGPGGPVSPQRSRILLIALLLGLAIPAVWIYFIETTNTTVRGRQDVEDLAVPFVGEIPLAYPKNKYHLPFHKSHKDLDMVVVRPRNRDVINEAFRVARANLEFMCDSSKCNVLMTTSFNVGSGKSFSSLNMAISLALKSKRVCIVDMDLRKRTISRYVKAPKVGVTEFLSFKLEDLGSVIMHDNLAKNLDVLPAGSTPPNPTELLYSENMSKMMDYLRVHYDYVFLDCPPVEIVADTSIVAPFVDHTMFIIRAGLLDRSMLPTVDRYYESKKYKGMVLLLNATDINSRTSYNRYGYNYGHRYGYGYGYGGGYGYGYGYGKAYGLAYGNEEDEKEASESDKQDTKKKA